MELVSDILLGGGAILAAAYCMILSKKLTKLNGLDQDLGGAIAVLSQQVDEMSRVLIAAQDSTASSSEELKNKTKAAHDIAARLELLLTALHDLPDPDSVQSQEQLADNELGEAIKQTTEATVFMSSRQNRAAAK